MPEVNEETVLILSALLKKSLRSATWVHKLELVTTCLEVYLTPQKSAWEACILQYSIFSTKIPHHQHLRIFFTESHKLGAVLELFSRCATCISLTCHKHLITTTHCTMTRKLNAAGLLFTNASESKRMIRASCKTKHIFNGGIRFLSHQWHLSTPNQHRFYNTCRVSEHTAHHCFPSCLDGCSDFTVCCPQYSFSLTPDLTHYCSHYLLPYQPNLTSSNKSSFHKPVFLTAEFNYVLFVPSMAYSTSSSHFSNYFQEGGYTSSRTHRSVSSKEIGT